MTHHQRTTVVSAGRPHAPNAPVNPPVSFTSTFMYRPSVESTRDYAREGTPSYEPLEELLAQLEGGTHGLLFSSGMAAVSAVLNLLPLGGHLILPTHAYMGSSVVAQEMAAKGLITLHRVDISQTEQVVQTVAEVAKQVQSEPGTAEQLNALLWIESPTNPMLEVADLPALVAAAKEHGIATAVDNTFATPLRQNPLAHGADVVVHSVTKFIAGHSDLIMGAVVTSDDELHHALHGHRGLHGAIPGPMEVFLALRGVRTMAIRLDASERNAAFLAAKLTELIDDDAVPVASVSYPGLPSHPQHERAAEQFSGFGAILTFDTGSAAAADAVLEQLQVFTPATSLGGVESLAERRRRHHTEPESVPEGLIRLSVGIEDAEDLYADLLQSLRAANLR